MSATAHLIAPSRPVHYWVRKRARREQSPWHRVLGASGQGWGEIRVLPALCGSAPTPRWGMTSWSFRPLPFQGTVFCGQCEAHP